MLLRLVFVSALLNLCFTVANLQASCQTNFCNLDSSPEYMAAWKSFSEKAKPTSEEKGEYFSKVYDFAVQGEVAAIDTMLDTYKNNLRNQIGVLRPLVVHNKTNLYAMLCLGRRLLDANDPEGLKWFGMAAACGQRIQDLDYWPNHADAILRFAPNKEESLRQCWELLKAWPFEPDDHTDISALHMHYFVMISRAAKLQLDGFLGDVITWDTKTGQHNSISDAITKALNGTRYMEKSNHQDVAFDFPDKESIERILLTIHGINEDMGQKHRAAEQIHIEAGDIVIGNFRSLMEKDEMCNIPYAEAHKRFFADFNPHQPGIDHLRMWARIIMESQRAALILYSGQDYDLIKYFSEVDNKTLYGICLQALSAYYKDDK
jgi:hypothetical protein